MLVPVVYFLSSILSLILSTTLFILFPFSPPQLESVECVKVLLTFGADTSCTDREERTPLDVATINRKPVFLKSIVKRQSSGASWTFISTDPGKFDYI